MNHRVATCPNCGRYFTVTTSRVMWCSWACFTDPNRRKSRTYRYGPGQRRWNILQREVHSRFAHLPTESVLSVVADLIQSLVAGDAEWPLSSQDFIDAVRDERARWGDRFKERSLSHPDRSGLTLGERIGII